MFNDPSTFFLNVNRQNSLQDGNREPFWLNLFLIKIKNREFIFFVMKSF